MNEKEHIPMDRCKEGFLYIIDARNSNLGIYNEANKSFTISRYKFGSNFLFDEFHWDTNPPFGTVRPLKEIMKVPVMSDEEKLAFLNAKWVELKEEVSSYFPDITRDFNWTETGWFGKVNISERGGAGRRTGLKTRREQSHGSSILLARIEK